jgi:hypothetical protein
MAVLIQKPEMAYSPRHEGVRSPRIATSPYDLYADKSYERSPFSPVVTPLPSPAGYTHKNSYEPSAISKAPSDTSYPSGPSSPARSSHGPGIQQIVRDSCHSDWSSNSQEYALASPRPFNQTGDVESQRNMRNPASSRAKSQGHHSSSRGSEREELEGVRQEPNALKVLVCPLHFLSLLEHINIRLRAVLHLIDQFFANAFGIAINLQ